MSFQYVVLAENQKSVSKLLIRFDHRLYLANRRGGPICVSLAPGGGGVMTLHDYGYLPPGFLKSYPVSERNFQIYTLPRSLAFFRGFFGESIVMQISFVMLIILLFSIVFKPIVFWGRGKFPGQIA